MSKKEKLYDNEKENELSTAYTIVEGIFRKIYVTQDKQMIMKTN